MRIIGHIQEVLLSIVTKFCTLARIYSAINTDCRLQCVYLITFFHSLYHIAVGKAIRVRTYLDH